MNTNPKLRALLLAGVAMTFSGQAWGQTQVFVTNPFLNVQDTAVAQGIVTVNRNLAVVDGSLLRVEQALIRALQGHSTQGTSNSQQAVQTEASMRETQDNRIVTGRLEDRRYEAQLSASSGASACNIITGVVGSTGLVRNAATYSAGLTRAALDYQLGESRTASVRNGTQAAIQERISEVCTHFGTQSMVDQGICSAVTQTASVNPPAPSPPGEPPAGVPSDSLNANIVLEGSVLSPRALHAARVFVGNAFVSAPQGHVPRAMTESAEGRSIIAAGWTSAARNSIALTTFNGAIAARKPDARNASAIMQPASGSATSTPTTTVGQWAEGTASLMLGGLPSGSNYPLGVSLHAWMDIRARSFYLDPQFQLRVNQQDMNANSKDMVLIQGFQTYLQWEQYKQQERTNVLLATMVSMMDQQNTTTRLGAPR